MTKPESRIPELKARLDSLIDAQTLPRAPSPGYAQRKKSWGMTMLILSVFVLAAGLHLPSSDTIGRAIFVFGALLYAGVGAWSFDLGNRRAGRDSQPG